ncbi:H-type small acid-soluble spore protein [Pullulanibacillus sp. KACC 23026]|uniref:H-type small acid-soluble spore protein n=1 Tax=Pullulanibacillus sp. KACC 23026 TaxID=3028315 RepID=UPI0023B1A8B1|nr:H-type small acid-soluble spore protein [Pullulanibacillus sp. KACC 23026]WEG13005.1 H-type small acid-soluble spore protein [Pullulanibacillus sp. KACC 23026]
MDANRAREILEANYMIQVNLAGIPVFIQKVNEDGLTAQVFPLDEPDHEQVVTLNQLEEG